MTTSQNDKPIQPGMDQIAKQWAFDAAMEQARATLQLETLETRKHDALDFREIPVWLIRELVRNAFEAGYHEGLCTGYRQGRGDACHEGMGEKVPFNPRNPQLPT